MFRVSSASGDTQTQGVVVVLGCSGYPRHPGILRHKGWWLVGVPGLSSDVPGILDIRGYSDTRGGCWWEFLDCPWMFRVSSASGDTQTQGVVVGGSPWIVLGCSGYPWHPGILRHKGWWLVGVPGWSLDVPGILGIRGYSDTRGGGWWESLDFLWMGSLMFRTSGDGCLEVHTGTPGQSSHTKACLPGHPKKVLWYSM